MRHNKEFSCSIVDMKPVSSCISTAYCFQKNLIKAFEVVIEPFKLAGICKNSCFSADIDILVCLSDLGPLWCHLRYIFKLPI